MVALTPRGPQMTVSRAFPVDPEALPFAARIAVDMPIGLSDTGERGCEALARRILSPRGSCVFPVPARGVLAFDDLAAARRWSVARTGKSIPAQSWNILPKIRELDGLISPAHQMQVRESHPELGFTRLNNGVPLPPKKSAQGRVARLALLAGAGLPGVAQLMDALPRKWVAADDVIDAAMLALTAQAMAAGTARGLGGRMDGTGKRMEIWY